MLLSHGFERLGHAGLQRLDHQRRPQADHLGDPRRVAGDGREHAVGFDVPAIGLHAHDLAVLDVDAGHGRLLVNLDAAAVGLAGVAPGHRVVPHDRARRMIERAHDRRVAAARQIDVRADAVDFLGRDHVAVHAQVLVHLGPPAHGAQRALGVGQREVPALGVEQVDVQVLRQLGKEPHAFLVELDPFDRQIVGADDGRVAAGVAAADVALVEHGDVGHAVVAGQVVGDAQAVPARADDDRVVAVLEPIVLAEHPRLGILAAQGESKQSIGHRPDSLAAQRVTFAPQCPNRSHHVNRAAGRREAAGWHPLTTARCRPHIAPCAAPGPAFPGQRRAGAGVKDCPSGFIRGGSP